MNDSGKTTVTDMTRLGLLLLTAAVLLADPVFTRGDEVMLIVEKPPADGLVVAQVDLTAAVQRCADGRTGGTTGHYRTRRTERAHPTGPRRRL